jgi:hypothetical protein
MGRIKGSKNKPKTLTEHHIDDSKSGDRNELMEGVTQLSNGGMAIQADKFKPLPDNWFSLSKVQKLEWLTANPRK